MTLMPRSLMNPKSVLVFLVVLLTWTMQMNSAPASGSAAISVRFVSNGVPMGASEVAGVIAKSNWNNANGNTMNSPQALADEFGNASGATIVWQADNLHALPIPDQPGNVRMMTGYLDTHNGDATKVTVSGLAANSAGYNVYVYMDGDNGSATRSATYQITGAGITTSILQTDPANTNFSGAFTQANNSNGNYVVFSINSSGFTLLAIPGPASDGIQRAPLNGIQIVPVGQVSNPDFTLSSAPNSSTVNSGSSTTSTVSVGALNGFSGSVNLSVSGLPAGATASLSPVSVTPGSNSTLTVSTSPNTPTGSTMLNITGAIASLTHTVGLALTVNNAVGGAPAGKTISIKFSGSGTAMASTEVAGVVPKNNWNNEGWFSGTSASVIDETGAVSGATVSWKADGLHALPIADQPGNARMMRGYLDGIANATTATVSGLPANANGYSVYVYADGDNGTATRTAIYQISGPGITTTSVTLTDATNTNFNGTFTQANNSAGNYVVFGINATGFTISATASTASDGTQRAPLNGMQIVAIDGTVPTNLTTTVASASQINLSWTASVGTVGVTGYNVERCSGAGCSNFAQIATPATTTFNDAGLTASTSYSYRVRAVDAAGNISGYSNTSSATTPAGADTTPPTLPTNLTATAASSSQINLAWTASTDNVGVTGYKVERCSGAGCSNFAQIATPTATTFNDTGLASSTSNSYRVRANDTAGNNSGYSNTASATTQATSGNVSVTISPKRGGLTTTRTMAFTAVVTNDVGSAGVMWSASSGTFNAQSTSAATFVAPNTAGVVTVTATSVADVTKSASATIGVTNLAGVFTYHDDLSRDGVNAQEYALTTANVATATFGKLFSCAADAAIYAQPLWAANLNIQSGTHNLVFAATVHDTVYAFDADTNPCVKYWSVSLLGSGETWVSSSDVGSGDIAPEVGIIGTPVIDPATNTLYVVSKSKNTGSNCTPATSCHQRLHALSLIDGSEKFGGPADITSAISVPGTGDGSSGGNVPFDTLRQNQRPGLVLSNGVVYVAWASHGDNGPYHGWVIGFDKMTLARVATFNANPNGSESGIWMGGGAPAADSSGNLYFLTGNGTFDVNTGGSDYGDSTVKLGTSGGLSVAGYFTPADQQNLQGGDTDHGSGGAAILVDQASGAPHQHLVIGGGKEGNFFLLDRDKMGGYGANFNPVDSNAVQKFSEGNGIFSTAAFFNNALYIAGAGGNLKSFAFNTTTGQFNAAQTSQSAGSFGFPGATPSVSALGTTNGILWAMDNGQYCTAQSPGCGAVVLHAFDATQLSSELWNSSQTAGDKAGNAVKFTVPTVANGKVYIGTRGNDTGNGGTTTPGEIDVYGLKPN